MTNCNDPRSYLITGLQSFTQYSVSVTVCTIVGEGPMATVPSGMTMTLPGTPTRLQSITATRTTSSVAFRWNAAQFNGPPGTYEVSLYIYSSFSLLNCFELTYSSFRLITLVMDVEVLFLILFLLLPILIILFLVSTVMKQIVMRELEPVIQLAIWVCIAQSLEVALLAQLCSLHQHQ